MNIPTHRWPWLQRILSLGFVILFRTLYRIRITGLEHLPKSGGALLVSNHLSFLDGPLLMMTVLPRPIHMLVYAGNFRNTWWRKWGTLWGSIYIDTGPKSMVRALRHAREALEGGHLVGIFAEGGISRTGQLQSFRPGLQKIAAGTEQPIIPVCMDGVWGSLLSFSQGRFFWKWPSRWRIPIHIAIGPPLSDQADPATIRQEVMKMSATIVSERPRPFRSLPSSFTRMCKRKLRVSKVADSSGTDLTGGELLMRSLILRRILRREVLARHEEYVGLLLPPSAGGLLANMALVLDRRIPIHLNYTMNSSGLNECIALAGLRTILTSRQVMSKLNLQLDANLVYLEDLKNKLLWTDKVAGATWAYLLPAFMINAILGLGRCCGATTATIVFTSGSTGTPKGVVLSYDNIASNVEAIEAIIRLRSTDVVLGILPFFHSFGYTVTLWTPMALDLKAVYHFSPLDGRRIGQLAEKHGATILLSTPTFLRSYIKRCAPEQFRTLDVVIAGAEKLPLALADAFEKQFGVRPAEGYGCTELSPLVSVNIPVSRSSSEFQIERKDGSVGRPIPNVAARIVDRETGQELGPNQTGLLQIKGPNVMQGYFRRPDLTEEVIQDGWYNTGDVSLIDDDGFIFITGRESRFSKIGGEMVPHLLIEEALNELVGVADDDVLTLAVTAVPDEQKGERLVVLHRPWNKSASVLCEALAQRGLPNLFIPAADSFVEVPEIPILGSGKLDLKRLRELACEKTGVAQPQAI